MDQIRVRRVLKKEDTGCILHFVSDQNTKGLTDKRSFEERVFARFDAMDARFNAVDARFDSMDARFDAVDARFERVEARLEALEVEGEKRALETKPIWERALAEILEVKERVADVERKVGVVHSDMMQLRADQVRLEDRMDKLESKPS